MEYRRSDVYTSCTLDTAHCACSAWCRQPSGATSRTSAPPERATAGDWHRGSSAALQLKNEYTRFSLTPKTQSIFILIFNISVTFAKVHVSVNKNETNSETLQDVNKKKPHNNSW